MRENMLELELENQETTKEALTETQETREVETPSDYWTWLGNEYERKIDRASTRGDLSAARQLQVERDKHLSHDYRNSRNGHREMVEWSNYYKRGNTSKASETVGTSSEVSETDTPSERVEATEGDETVGYSSDYYKHQMERAIANGNSIAYSNAKNNYAKAKVRETT